VVGEGARLHAEAGDARDEVVDLAGPVEEGVVAVDVKVDELRFHERDYRGEWRIENKE
jgi:hypothetical protein